MGSFQRMTAKEARQALGLEPPGETSKNTTEKSSKWARETKAPAVKGAPPAATKFTGAAPVKESTIQKQCVKWLRSQYPEAFLFSIPNDAMRSETARGKGLLFHMLAMGFTAGVPDLFIAEPRGPYHGLFVEMKAAGKKPSPKQKAVHETLRGKSYLVEVTDSFEKFVDVVKFYFNGIV